MGSTAPEAYFQPTPAGQQYPQLMDSLPPVPRWQLAPLQPQQQQQQIAEDQVTVMDRMMSSEINQHNQARTNVQYWFGVAMRFQRDFLAEKHVVNLLQSTLNDVRNQLRQAELTKSAAEKDLENLLLERDMEQQFQVGHPSIHCQSF
jgi:hypothetical protein